jgi:hypothetical protein
MKQTLKPAAAALLGGTSAVNMFDLETAVPIGAYIHAQADRKRVSQGPCG